ncbi:hypothetical protein [Neorhodopirellula pilleata]|uniref:Secreted protein n=1 Tax=Neorhodopirellula pilleata TaxID=2714738 RepID=A0A5C5ZH22_9BACT|nr:hypothetical protein [Neorhodopirellula pilleata]TWT86458.1 hypothetical protein Pla100_60290 [Neorhodopirellula pilleata]
MKKLTGFALLILATNQAWSEPPPPLPSEYPPPTEVPANAPESDPAAERIREALQSGRTAPTPGLLGDVLDVIREKGSILDGSILDPRMEAEAAAQEQSPNPNRRPPGDLSMIQNASETVRTAELLLRSARRLEKVADGDDRCARLIHQMRVQATSMLADLYLSP